MRALTIIAAGLMLSVGAVYAFQMPFRTLISQEGYNNEPIPADYLDHNEFVIGRLMYPNGGRGGFGGGGFRGGRWGPGGTSWVNGYPIRGPAFPRHLRRLTPIGTRPVR